MEASGALDRNTRYYSFWGRHASLYAATTRAIVLGRERFLRRTAVARLGLKRGDRVLEVGCGTGRSFPYLIDAIGSEGRLVALDYSHEMLANARSRCEQNGWQNVRLVQGDAAVLDVGEGDFDGVLCDLCLSTIPEHKKALERCRDALRSGGAVSVLDMHLFTGAARILNPLVWAITRLSGDPWNPTRDTPGAMREVLGNVDAHYYNWGLAFIATSIKRAL